MDRVGAADQRRGDDVRNVEIRAHHRAGTDAERLVGVAHVQRLAIDVGEDGDGRHAELVTRAIDAQRDLAAVGDQDFLEHLRGAPPRERAEERGACCHGGHLSIANSGWPYSTGWPSVTRTALIRPGPRARTALRMPSVST